ncbi:hypothetical protein D3C78_1608140 [compost metagenome]
MFRRTALCMQPDIQPPWILLIALVEEGVISIKAWSRKLHDFTIEQLSDLYFCTSDCCRRTNYFDPFAIYAGDFINGRFEQGSHRAERIANQVQFVLDDKL